MKLKKQKCLKDSDFPLRVLDLQDEAIYSCDDQSQFYEWIDDKEAELQTHLTFFNRVVRVEESIF